MDTAVINIVDTVDCVAANHAYLKTPYSSKSELKNVCAISSNYLRKKINTNVMSRNCIFCCSSCLYMYVKVLDFTCVQCVWTCMLMLSMTVMMYWISENRQLSLAGLEVTESDGL